MSCSTILLCDGNLETHVIGIGNDVTLCGLTGETSEYSEQEIIVAVCKAEITCLQCKKMVINAPQVTLSQAPRARLIKEGTHNQDLPSIVYLEGTEHAATHLERDFKTALAKQYNLFILAGLYRNPTSLSILKEIEPLTLLIQTTFIRGEEVKAIIKVFKSLQIKPQILLHAVSSDILRTYAQDMPNVYVVHEEDLKLVLKPNV